jgi:hypothetical protein
MPTDPFSAADARDPACVAKWPECESGAYDPRCCRFPKSCSCTAYDEPAAASAPRFTERGAECRKQHVRGYTGPICSCGPMECKAVRENSENERFDREPTAASACECVEPDCLRNHPAAKKSRPFWGYVQVRICPRGDERAPVALREVDDWRSPREAAAVLREIAADLDEKETWNA